MSIFDAIMAFIVAEHQNATEAAQAITGTDAEFETAMQKYDENFDAALQNFEQQVQGIVDEVKA